MAMGQKEIGQRTRVFSAGLAGSASELMLLSIYFNLDLGSVTEHPLDQEASAAVKDINFSSFKRALTHLKSKGFITESDGTNTGYVLTESGKQEVQNSIPTYKYERHWDGKVYLVNYDLPVSSNSARNAFRDFIKQIGFGMIQHSLWLNPYDPREKLMSYINDNTMNKEDVIVSAINIEVELYGYQIPQLVEKAFNLNEVNSRYRGFIEESEQGISRERKIFRFLSILKDDPQLPYDLIPQDWAGYRAKELFDEVI